MLLLMLKSEKETTTKSVSIPPVGQQKIYNLTAFPDSNQMIITLYGAFLSSDYANSSINFLTVNIEGAIKNFKSNDTNIIKKVFISIKSDSF